MSDEKLILDNTKRSTFRQCKMKYYLQHVKGWQSDYGSTAILYGVVWHGIQEGYHNWVKEHGWPKAPDEHMAALTAGLELGKKKWDSERKKKTFVDDYKNFNTAVAAFAAYLAFFEQDKDYIKIISTETKFECPMLPDSELEERVLSKLPPVIFTGKIDLSVEMDSQKWMFDFKTTGWILDQVIAKANRSPQFIGYSYAGDKVLDFKPNGCLASFHYVGAYKSKKTGEYGESKFDFKRVPQIYTAGDIAAWKLSFIDTCKDIYYAMQYDFWPESFDNCYQYGACPYLRICQQHRPYEQLNFDGFHQDFWDVLVEED